MKNKQIRSAGPIRDAVNRYLYRGFSVVSTQGIYDALGNKDLGAKKVDGEWVTGELDIRGLAGPKIDLYGTAEAARYTGRSERWVELRMKENRDLFDKPFGRIVTTTSSWDNFFRQTMPRERAGEEVKKARRRLPAIKAEQKERFKSIEQERERKELDPWVDLPDGASPRKKEKAPEGGAE